MSSDLAIRARGVTKRYRIRTDGHEGSRHSSREWYTALDSVDLDVSNGEVVGLIGRNGAGKSTLLKVLSRITSPDGGEIDLWGRVGSLLEVGTGFHPELTGRENVFLNGAILGMKRREIQAQFANIVEFADIGPFLDTPVKRYSSGMHVRLAFAVAAHLNPEILIVDEVLAVGDADFQRRCLGKMNDVATKQGRTVIFVSHNMASIEHLCSRVVILDSGRVTYMATAADAIAHYLSSATVIGSHVGRGVYGVDGEFVTRIATTDGARAVDQVLTGRPLTVLLDVKNFHRLRIPLVTVRVRTPNDQVVFSASTRMKALSLTDQRDGLDRLELHIPDLPLIPGRYWLYVGVGDVYDNTLKEAFQHAGELEVVGGSNVYGTGYQPKAADGVVYVAHEWCVGTREADTAVTGAPTPISESP